MLLQLDGSDHDWLEGRGHHLALLAAIDDATSEVVRALFREEGPSVAFIVLQGKIESAAPAGVGDDKNPAPSAELGT
jgi:hypothetical protein